MISLESVQEIIWTLLYCKNFHFFQIVWGRFDL